MLLRLCFRSRENNRKTRLHWFQAQNKIYILQYLIFPQPYLENMKRAVTTKLGAYILTHLTNPGKTTPVNQYKAR